MLLEQPKSQTQPLPPILSHRRRLHKNLCAHGNLKLCFHVLSHSVQEKSHCLFQSMWLTHQIRCQLGSSHRACWFLPHMSQSAICSRSSFLTTQMSLRLTMVPLCLKLHLDKKMTCSSNRHNRTCVCTVPCESIHTSLTLSHFATKYKLRCSLLLYIF